MSNKKSEQGLKKTWKEVLYGLILGAVFFFFRIEEMTLEKKNRDLPKKIESHYLVIISSLTDQSLVFSIFLMFQVLQRQTSSVMHMNILHLLKYLSFLYMVNE